MLGFSDDVRSAQMQVVADAIDADPSPGYMEMYDGDQPATGAAVTDQTLLGVLTFSQPCGTVTAGVLEFDTITGEDGALDNGTITWARVYDGAGTFIMDVDVGTAGQGKAITLNTTTVTTGTPISLTEGAITAGNIGVT
jgi:hypothetical protein